MCFGFAMRGSSSSEERCQERLCRSWMLESGTPLSGHNQPGIRLLDYTITVLGFDVA